MDDMKRFDQLRHWSARRSEINDDPDLNVIDVTPKLLKLAFKHKMPIGKRIDLFLMSSVMLLVGLVAAGLTGVFLYVFISVLF